MGSTKTNAAAAGVEIERKFLVSRMPDGIGVARHCEIIQAYIKNTEGEEVRMRKSDGKFSITTKAGRGLKRSEATEEITEGEYKSLLGSVVGGVIEKTRYVLPYGGLAIELDVYGGGLKGLAVAEVEFKSVAESRRFVPPAWFGAEVTYDDRYKNKALSRFGIPG